MTFDFTDLLGDWITVRHIAILLHSNYYIQQILNASSLGCAESR